MIEHRERWIAIGLDTKPANRPMAEVAVADMYRLGGVLPPAKIVWCGSPLSCVLACASIGDSVGASIGDSVGASIGDSVGASIGDSVRASVWASIGASVGNFVRASVRASVGASVGNFVY